MLGEMKKLKLLVIMTSCVLLTGAIFQGDLFAETVIEEWVATYNGLGNGYDFANAVAVDSVGNIYVTGQSWGGTTHYDYATIKYDSAGNQLWIARYDGLGNGHDNTSAIAVDSLGNVYVTGFCYSGNNVNFDYATIKYDAVGNQLWVACYDGPTNTHDYATAMAVDSAGSVYVTGRSKSSETNFDYATIKYDTDGNELWAARYDFSGYAEDEACAIAVDSEGNVYVTGLSWNMGTHHDYATVKYDTDGNQLWVARYDGPDSYYDEPVAIALDSEGNIYVTGDSQSSTLEDFTTVKYDPSGTQLWAARYNGPGNGWDFTAAMALDSSDNVYITGRSSGESGDDYATVKYDADGNQLWVARYNGPANNEDYPEAVAVDSLDNVYVTGWSYGDSSIGYDYATVKYDSSGNELWVTRYNGPGNGGDFSAAMALDTSGSVYVTGQSDGIETYDDYATIKYSQQADPVDLLLELAQDVIELNLKNGIENSLDAKLGAALQALDDINTNNDDAAINTLEAFVYAVEAQRGKEISEADADELIAVALEIIALLSSE
jgi:uncharacterized delta-60 repeat protein